MGNEQTLSLQPIEFYYQRICAEEAVSRAFLKRILLYYQVFQTHSGMEQSYLGYFLSFKGWTRLLRLLSKKRWRRFVKYILKWAVILQIFCISNLVRCSMETWKISSIKSNIISKALIIPTLFHSATLLWIEIPKDEASQAQETSMDSESQRFCPQITKIVWMKFFHSNDFDVVY